MRNFQQNTVRAKNIPINSGLSWWFELDYTETSNEEQPKITDNNLIIRVHLLNYFTREDKTENSFLNCQFSKQR